MTSRIWSDRVQRNLKAELKRAGVTYEELARRLTEIDLPETKGSIAMKLSRGGYPAWFLFAALHVVGVQTLRMEEWT